MKKKLPILLLTLLLLLPACREESAEKGSVCVRVLDGFSGAPIEGAAVTVPETGGRFYSHADGRTENMLLPVIPDTEYEYLLPSGSGRITLLVTAQGYTPYLLLYARVEPGHTRGVDVLLFPDDGSLPVFTVIEAPDAEWCRALAEKWAE